MTQLSDAREFMTAALFGPAIIARLPTRAEEDRVGRHDSVDLAVSRRDALTARFPVVRRLLCDETFGAVAWQHAIGERTPDRTRFSDTFPRRLRGFGPGAAIDYLADVADLEMIRHRAARAPDASPLELAAFASLRLGRMAMTKVTLHPSVGLVASRFPIIAIWEANQTDDEDRNVMTRWRPESALVARPFRKIEMRRLEPGGIQFLDCLSRRGTIGAAIEVGRAAAPDFDIGGHLLLLIDAGIVVALHD